MTPWPRELANALERGRFDRRPLRALARLWAPLAARGLVRPLDVPDRVFAVTVGGATLGGSGKTTVAIAIARLLAARGHAVAFVGHGYGTRLRGPRLVVASDAVADVGDEALLAARTMPPGVDVIVAPTRQAAIDHAVRRGSVCVVLDGPLRVRNAARSLAVLAVDRDVPWGGGDVLPAGDLRARPHDLLALADHVVPVDAGAFETPRLDVGIRYGLFTALARPERLVRALANVGVVPRVRVHAPDHGPLSRSLRARLRGADVWLTTAKCALHLEGLPLRRLVLHAQVSLPKELVASLETHVREVGPNLHPAESRLDPRSEPTSGKCAHGTP